MPPSPQVAVGAVVVRAGALLLVRRARAPAANRWSLPGGRVVAGEPLAAAVARELAEETGLHGEVHGLCGIAERIDETSHFVILDYWVSVPAGDDGAAADDAGELSWAGRGDLARLPLVDGLLEWLDAHGVLDRLRA